MEVLPERQGGETESDIRKLHSSKMPKLTPFEVLKLQTCDRPLGEGGRSEMSVERQWAESEAANLLKKDPAKEEEKEEEKITTTVAPRPKPPSKAPTELAMGPISSRYLLGGGGGG